MSELQFYKVFLQENRDSIPIYERLNRTDFLIGNFPNSYAIPYSPNHFSRWMSESKVFTIFIHSSIKQALLNNNKFAHILEMSEPLGIRVVDCQFENIELDDVLDGEELDTEVIHYLLKTKGYKLLKVTFRSEHNFIFNIKRNGVIGIDENFFEKDQKTIRNLLDVLNLGYGVML